MAGGTSTCEHTIEVKVITQVPFAYFASKSLNQLSTITAGCDNMQVFVPDLYQFLEDVAADEAVCTGYQDRMGHIVALVIRPSYDYRIIYTG